MNTQVIYFENANSLIGNTVCSVSPKFTGTLDEAAAKFIKEQRLAEDTVWQLVEDALEPVFKNARKVESGKLIADLEKSKLIAHEYRRRKRSKEFLEVDGDNIQVQVMPAAEAQRQSIRDRYDTIQANLDAKSTVADLKAEMEKEGLI